MNKNEYLLKLKKIYTQIPYEFEKEIFYYICKTYQQSLIQKDATKYATKEEIIKHLISKGLMSMNTDKKTGEPKLPDDRIVRSAVRNLMKNGIPILSSSSIAGYYICDDINEIEQPFNENHKRALRLLAMEKSFKKIAGFVGGQLEIDNIDLTTNNLCDFDE